MEPPRITSFLVKVASRCNLDCDYCYVYHHADQSWRSMPRVMSAEHRKSLVDRIAAYAAEANLRECVVVIHGGEPLLIGADVIVDFAASLRSATPDEVKVDVSLQTNGLLLTEPVLRALEQADIGVSLSLDGPREVNDLHRNTRKGRSSFDKTLAALERLKRHPKSFAGVIAVIDPRVPPRTLFEFFSAHRLPRLDFLLPDAHHERPPPGRADQPDLYRRWLVEAFDLWLDEYPEIPVRTFEALLDAVAGLPSATDAFGFGDVSLITIETDGSYHDLDVLKVTADGLSRLSGTVADTAISEVARHSALARHRLLLRKEGLSETCRACELADICGGGSVPHRYGGGGFDNPSVYCGELFALISHVRRRLSEHLAQAPSSCAPAAMDLAAYELAETSTTLLDSFCQVAAEDYADRLLALANTMARRDPAFASTADELHRLPREHLREIASRPGAVAWRQATEAIVADRAVHAVDGTRLLLDQRYLRQLMENDGGGLRVADDDRWLRLPFGSAVEFEADTAAAKARPIISEAFDIIRRWRAALLGEMRAICRAVQFIRDPTAHPDKIVSFSDNSVPGALYVSVRQGDGLIDAYDLADSLIHEHRHQKLYLLERVSPIVEPNSLQVVSPWRDDLRPPSGLFHAVFVFVELRRFWLHVRDQGPARLHNRAVNQLADTDAHLSQAFETLATCPLTAEGRQLLSILDEARHTAAAPA